MVDLVLWTKLAGICRKLLKLGGRDNWHEAMKIALKGADKLGIEEDNKLVQQFLDSCGLGVPEERRRKHENKTCDCCGRETKGAPLVVAAPPPRVPRAQRPNRGPSRRRGK